MASLPQERRLSARLIDRIASAFTSNPPNLRALQKLSGIEKRAMGFARGLADELDKSVEWLRYWGVGEGEDLGDVLFHSTNLYIQLSGALVQYASYGEQIRAHFKSIRARERRLRDMRGRRTSVANRTDAVEKGLTKVKSSSAEHAALTQALRELKEEGQRLGTEVVNEEAAIGDYKRQATKEFMGLKFDGILELAEKMTASSIIGEMGKLILEETPLGTTPPGHPRAPYTGRERTAALSSQTIGRLSTARGQPDAHPIPELYDLQHNNSHPSSPISQSRPSIFIVQTPDGYGEDTQFGQAPFGSGPPAGISLSSMPGRTGGFNAGIGEVGRLQTRRSSTPAGISERLSRNEAITVSSRATDTFSQSSSFTGTNNGGTLPPYRASVLRAESPLSELSSGGTSHHSKPGFTFFQQPTSPTPSNSSLKSPLSELSSSGTSDHSKPGFAFYRPLPSPMLTLSDSSSPSQVANATPPSTSGSVPHKTPPYAADEAHNHITPSPIRSPISSPIPEL